MFKLRKTIKTKQGIYGIKNLVTKTIYIGSAENVRARLSSHFSALIKDKHYNKELQEDFNLYGIDSFTYMIFRYSVKNKISAENTLLKKLLQNNVKVYNYTMPSSNIRFKIATRNTTKYILTNNKLQRTYIHVTNLGEFYDHNKVYGCPSITFLYDMVLKKKTHPIWSIEIDAKNAEEIITSRNNKKGARGLVNKVYYKRLIDWKITNILTAEEHIVSNLMKWCIDNKIHYNQFQRYQNSGRIYKDTWKLDKIAVI